MELVRKFIFIFIISLTVILSKSGFAGQLESDGAYLPNIDTVVVYTSWETSKYVYQYDSNDRRVSYLWFKLNGNDWLPYQGATYSYDQGRLVEILTEYISGEEWINSFRQTYQYDDNGNLTVYLEENWDENNSVWVNSNRDTYEYENNLVVSDIDEYWANEWIKHRKYTTKYNAAGLKDTTFEASWYNNSEWVDFKRQYYNYDENGNLIFQMDEALNDNNDWDEKYRHNFTYNDTTGLLTRELVEYYNSDTWLNAQQKTYYYNENYKLTDFIYESSSGGTYYDNREKISSDYNENDLLSQKFGYKWDGYQWAQYDRVLNFTYKDELFTAYGYNLTIHYAEEAAAIAEKNISVKRFELNQNYPNPFNPSTQIGFYLPQSGLVTLKIYDLRGREIATLINSKQNAGKHVIDFNALHYNLPSGFYIYTINSGDYFDVKKMILMK